LAIFKSHLVEKIRKDTKKVKGRSERFVKQKKRQTIEN